MINTIRTRDKKEINVKNLKKNIILSQEQRVFLVLLDDNLEKDEIKTQISIISELAKKNPKIPVELKIQFQGLFYNKNLKNSELKDIAIRGLNIFFSNEIINVFFKMLNNKSTSLENISMILECLGTHYEYREKIIPKLREYLENIRLNTFLRSTRIYYNRQSIFEKAIWALVLLEDRQYFIDKLLAPNIRQHSFTVLAMYLEAAAILRINEVINIAINFLNHNVEILRKKAIRVLKNADTFPKVEALILAYRRLERTNRTMSALKEIIENIDLFEYLIIKSKRDNGLLIFLEGEPHYFAALSAFFELQGGRNIPILEMYKDNKNDKIFSQLAERLLTYLIRYVGPTSELSFVL